MKLRSMLARSLVIATLCPPFAFAASPAAHWEYRGPHGTASWARLAPDYATCAAGHTQSPIDIRNAKTAALPGLDFAYGRIKPAIVNNGHTIQVTVPPGQFLQVGERRYELLQFHFHTPSEERIRGRASAMVAHFVHRDAEGKLGVVAALIEPGKPNTGFETVMSHLPARAGETLTVEGLELDLAGLLPSERRYYDFEGSLTTPPCSEGVHWMVLTRPVTVSNEALKRFRRLYPANARPVQPTNGREIRISS